MIKDFLEKKYEDLSKTKSPEAELSNWKKLFQELMESSSKNVFLFRGHAKTEFKLIPGIGREEKDGGRSYEYCRETELTIFNEFKSKYYSYSNERPNKRMDVLFLAQHYGLKTRLLDWSYSLAVALYLACKDCPDDNGCLCVKKIPHLKGYIKEESVDIDPFEIRENMILFPDYIDVRYRNQKAAFEIFADPTKETVCDYKFTIPSVIKKDILRYLDLMGVDESFIYPTLENLSKDIMKKYKM